MAITKVYLILIGCLHCTAVREYLYKAILLNFEEAEKECKSLGLEMALARDDVEIETMNAHLSSLDSSVTAWLGLVYKGEKGFEWLNGDRLSVNRWDVTTDNEPDNLDRQHCAVWRRSDNQWDSRECNKQHHLLCSGNIHVATFTVYKDDTSIPATALASMTSQSNINCAMTCKQLERCSFFTVELTSNECSMYSAESVATTLLNYRSGSRVWKMN